MFWETGIGQIKLVHNYVLFMCVVLSNILRNRPLFIVHVHYITEHTFSAHMQHFLNIIFNNLLKGCNTTLENSWCCFTMTIYEKQDRIASQIVTFKTLDITESILYITSIKDCSSWRRNKSEN